VEAFVEGQYFYRLIFSIGGLFLFMTLGLVFPYRKSKELHRPERWFNNLAFTFGNALLVRLFIPLSLVQIIELESLKPYKLLDFQAMNPWLLFAFGLILLDLAIYWQHRLTHKIPLLWRLHRVHHSDIEFDTTTAGRFHTLEILFSFALKAVIAVIFNLSAASIIAFEILLNFSSLFNHTNIHFPDKIEKVLRWLLITPDLHRIHHSTYHKEMNSNFGFSISLWDRLFKSFQNKGLNPQDSMTIGLIKFRSDKDQTLWALLKQPTLKD